MKFVSPRLIAKYDHSSLSLLIEFKHHIANAYIKNHRGGEGRVIA